MNIYYYLHSEKNDDQFQKIMDLMGIKYSKSIEYIFDKQYSFILPQDKDITLFYKLMMIDKLIDSPIYGFFPIDKDI